MKRSNKNGLVRHLSPEEIAECQKLYKPPTIEAKEKPAECTRLLTPDELKALDKHLFCLI